jgi:deoxycytidylate deaminase
MMFTKLESRVIHQASLVLPYCDGGYRHVSVLTHGRRIVSVGTNSYTKTHTKALKFKHRGNYIHSELSAIVHFPRKTNLRIQDCILYNLRVRPAGDFGLSAPCKSCRNLIDAFGIRKVFYTNNFGDFEEMN